MKYKFSKFFREWVEFIRLYDRQYHDVYKHDVPELKTMLDTLYSCPRPRYLKELVSKRVLVVGEGGYGDCVWLYRFLLELKNKAEVTFFTMRPLLELFKDVKTITTFPVDMRNYDCWIWMSDLLHLYNKVGKTDRYIDIPHKQLVDTTKLKIGFALGNADVPPEFEYRQVDQAVMLYFINDNWEIYNFSDRHNIFCNNNLYNQFDSFVTTCQWIENMDLMICADNVILHLAGALGKRTCGLFQDSHEWFWDDIPNSSLWYDSVLPIMIEVLDTPMIIAENIRKRMGL